MSEQIKSFADWRSESPDAPTDKIDALRSFTDYARLEYQKLGMLTPEVEQELKLGVENQLLADGDLSLDSPQEEKDAVKARLFAPKTDLAFDAGLVADYLNSTLASREANREDQDLLRKYVASRTYNPDAVADLEEPVRNVLKDSFLVRQARRYAVDRGELPAIGLTADDGTRDVYTGAGNIPDEQLPLVSATLLKTGALDGSDLVKLQQKNTKLFGGKSTLADVERATQFHETLRLMAKSDPDINNILSGATKAEAAETAAGLQSGAAKVGAFVTGSIGAALAGIGEAIVAPFTDDTPKETPEQDVYAYRFRGGSTSAAELIAEKLRDNPALKDQFSDEDIRRFTNDIITSTTDYQFDETKPESGIRELSTGVVTVAPALLAKPEVFEAALQKTALNDSQKEFARETRLAQLKERAPALVSDITAVDDDAASAYAVAQQSGKTPEQFVEEWFSNPDNYGKYSSRAKDIGLNAWADTKNLVFGLGALVSGSEGVARKASEASAEAIAEKERRRRVASMFGDDYGLGQEVLNAIPQVAVDMALTFGTAGVGGAAARSVTAAATRAAGRVAIANSAKAFAKMGVQSLDDVTLKTLRAATAKGGALRTSEALRAVGANWVGRAAGELGTQILPVVLPAFSRSASNSYVSIYSGLPKDMSHDEKHQIAFGSAVASGVATAAITVGMGKLGAGGPESLALKGVGKKNINDLTYREAKKVYEFVRNEGKAVSDGAFRRALAQEVGDAYRNIAKTSAGGATEEVKKQLIGPAGRMAAVNVGKSALGESFEEGLDQSINIAIEDAALKRDTPLADKIQQVWNAMLVGGVIGGGFNTASQLMPVSKSAETKALEARVSVLDGIAKRLSTSDAPQTAATVQRIIDDAKLAAAEAVKKDLAAQAQQDEQAPAADTTVVWKQPEQGEFTFSVDTRGLPPSNTRLADLVGEKVYVEGTNLSGIAEVDERTGEVVINFPAPTKTKGATKPITRMVLGPKFQKATGLTLKPKIKTLTKATDKLPVGASVIGVNKIEYVLPTKEEVDAAHFSSKPLITRINDAKGRLVSLRIDKVKLAKLPTASTSVEVTDKDLIREILRAFPAPEPTFKLEGDPDQLELDFSRKPAEQEATEEDRFVPAPQPFSLEDADQLEFDFNTPEEAAEFDNLVADPAQLELDLREVIPAEMQERLDELTLLVGNDPIINNLLKNTTIRDEEFIRRVQNVAEEDWQQAGMRIEAVYEFASNLPDNQALLAESTLAAITPISRRHSHGTTIRSQTQAAAAREKARADAARRNQSAPTPIPAPTEVAPEPTPEPTPPPAAKKAARKVAKKVAKQAAPAPETPPAAKKAAKKAAQKKPEVEPNKDEVLNKAAADLVKLRTALEKAGQYRTSLTGNKLARGIAQQLKSIGFDPAELPEAFLAQKNEDLVAPENPADIERLIASFKWASGQPAQTVEPTPTPEVAPITDQDVESWLDVAGNAEKLIGQKLTITRGGGEITIVSVDRDEDTGELLSIKDGDGMDTQREDILDEFETQSFAPYLEAGAPAPDMKGRGELVGQPTETEIAARVNEFTSREEAIDDWFDDKRRTLKAKFERLSAIDNAADPTGELFRATNALINAQDTMRERGIADTDGADYWRSAVDTLEMLLDADGVDTRPKAGAPAPAPEPRELTEEEEEALEDALRAQAEAEIDAGPIGQALAVVGGESDQEVDPLRDREGDLKKSKIKSFAKKLVENGVLDDVESVLDASRDRDYDAEDTLAELADLLDEARDSAIEERIEELRSERDQTLGFTPLEGDETLRQNISDHVAELQRLLPAGFTLVANPDMVGVLGYNQVTNPTAVLYNPRLIGSLTEGLSLADARATMRTAIDHELAHAAADAVFGRDGYEQLAAELGEAKLTEIADAYYALYEPNPVTRAALIKEDRASGDLPDWGIAAEWVRMEQERIVNGRTSEQHMRFLRTNPSLLARFVAALDAFVTRLKARFLEQPTSGTAASISRAARELRKLRNGGWLPSTPRGVLDENGESAALFEAIENGSDKISFMMPVSAASPAAQAKVDGVWARLKKKFTNLPPELRVADEARSGIHASGLDANVSFMKNYRRLLKASPDINLDDVRTMLGRTDPTLDNAALGRIQTELDAFANSLPSDMDAVEAEDLIKEKSDKLHQRERIASNTAFAKLQAAAEQRLRNDGHGDMADLVSRFRKSIDKMSDIYSDMSVVVTENEGIYLMREYRFFNTEGWAQLAAGGLLPDGSQIGMFRGAEVDFGKLRANAAKIYEEQVQAEAAKDGVVLTNEQLRDRTHALLDEYLAHLQSSAESIPSPSNASSLRKDLNRFLPKGNIDKAILDLLGVVQDPLESAIGTMNAVTKIAANHEFMKQTRSILLSSGLASIKPAGDNTVPAFGRFADPALSPLGELFTTPEIARALQAEFGPNGRNVEKNTDSVMREAGRVLLKASSIATTSKTLGTIGFYIRNVVSGQGLLLGAQGITPINRYTKRAWGMARRTYYEGLERTEDQEKFIARLIELQVLKDDTQGRVALDMLKGSVTNNEQELDSFLESYQRALSGDPKSFMEKLGGTYGGTVEFLAKANNWADGAVKLQAFMYELDVLKKDNEQLLEQAALVGDNSVLAKLEARAADKVKDTFPSHVRQYEWSKSLNRTTAGQIFFSFIRWKTEVIRTMFNTVPIAVKEIREGGPAERSRGIKRLIGFTTVVFLDGKVLGGVFSTIFNLLAKGLDDEEEKKDREGAQARSLDPEELFAFRASLPLWQQVHSLHTRLIGDKVQVIDITAMTPYSMVTDLFRIGYEGMQAGEGIQSKKIASYIATQIIGTQIAPTTAMEVLTNRDDFGQPIYFEGTDTIPEIFMKSMSHYAKGALKPGVWDFVQRATRTGEQDKWEIVAGELLGARPRGHGLSEVEYRAFRSAKKMLDDSKQIRSKLLTGRAMDPEEEQEIIRDHQEAMDRSQRNLAKVVKGLGKMGSPRSSVFQTSTAAGISKRMVALAERGISPRSTPSPEFLRSIYANMTRAGEEDPMARIKRYRAELEKMSASSNVLE